MIVILSYSDVSERVFHKLYDISMLPQNAGNVRLTYRGSHKIGELDIACRDEDTAERIKSYMSNMDYLLNNEERG